MERKYKEICLPYLIVFFFVAYFAVGLLGVQDYGQSTDEEVQRQHSLVAYKHINEKVLDREIEALKGLPNLEEYQFRYYGTALQIPLVMAEDFCGFQMTTRQVFLMRHCYNFLVCFLGNICFFFALKKIFHDKGLALLGTMLIALYPRFYGNQFFDIKNMTFVGLSMISFLALVNVVEKCNLKNILLFGFVTALSTNLRVMGVLFPVILVGYFVVADVTDLVYRIRGEEKRTRRDRAFYACGGKYLLVISAYFIFWFLITPLAWENPFQTFLKTFESFAHWTTREMNFAGRVINSAEGLPWYYIFVWFGVSIPLLYLLLFMLGHIYAIVSFCKSRNKWEDLLIRHKWMFCMLLFFWIPIGALVILELDIYIEWRHMYFVFVPFCCIAVYGFQYLLQLVNKRIAWGIVSVYILLQVAWSIWNHPYQYVYFNEIGRFFASGFDRDSWGVASYDMIQWILEQEEGQVDIWHMRITDYNMFTEEEKSRLYITRDRNEETKYIIDIYRYVLGNTVEYDGYEEVYAIWVDGFKIGSVFRMLE